MARRKDMSFARTECLNGSPEGFAPPSKFFILGQRDVMTR